MAVISLNTCDPYPWQAPYREKGPEPSICTLLWFKVLSLTDHCSNANGDLECSSAAAAKCWMPQSEGAALVSHTMLAPIPDCEVLLAVQGAGLKLSPTMYKTIQDRRQQKIQVLRDVALCCHWSSSWCFKGFVVPSCAWSWTSRRLPDCGDEGIMIFWNVRNYSTNHIVSHKRRLESSTKLPCKHKIFHGTE